METVRVGDWFRPHSMAVGTRLLVEGVYPKSVKNGSGYYSHGTYDVVDVAAEDVKSRLDEEERRIFRMAQEFAVVAYGALQAAIFAGHVKKVDGDLVEYHLFADCLDHAWTFQAAYEDSFSKDDGVDEGHGGKVDNKAGGAS